MTWQIDLTGCSFPEVNNANGLSLTQEVGRLSKINSAGLPEAVAFYAGRIVEGFTQLAAHRLQIKMEPNANLKEKLELLYLFGKLNEGVHSCAQAIRRLGNQARHLEREILGEEEDTIIALLQLWVEWYVHLATYNGKQPLAAFSDWSDKTKLIKVLAQTDSEQIHTLLSSSSQILSDLFSDASTAEFAAERLIDCRSPLASDFTKELLARHKKHIRPVQLRALFFSRNDMPEMAIETLKKVSYHPDAETLGILAGAYKNFWLKTASVDFLRKAREHYAKGVTKYPEDYYLRINLAATAHWQGERHEARINANETLNILSRYGFKINHGDNCSGISYWVVATLAEASLLSDNIKRAIYLYEQAKLIDHTKGRWRRTAQQLGLHLTHIKDSQELTSFAGKPSLEILHSLAESGLG